MTDDSECTKWESEIEDKLIESMRVANILIDDLDAKRQIILVLFDMLVLKLKKRSTDDYTKFCNKLFKSLNKIVKEISSKDSLFFVGAIANFFTDIKNITDTEIKKSFVNHYFKLVHKSIWVKNKELVIHLGYFASEICPDFSDRKDEYRDYLTKALLKCLEVYPDVSIIYLPDYENEIKDKIEDQAYVAKISENYKDLFDKIIRVEESETMYFYLDSLNNILLHFNSRHRNQHELILNVYTDLLTGCLIYKTFTNFNLAMYKFNEVINNVDKDGKFSTGIIHYIIDIYDRIGKIITAEHDNTLLNKYFDNLINLSDVLPSIEKDKKYKEQISEIIFGYGVEAIESNNETLLRRCSNSLGWYAKALIDKGDTENFKKIIEACSHLYNLSIDQNFDDSTRSFLGTLFIILGSYLYAKKSYVFSDFIKHKIERLKDVNPIRTSKRLREYGHKDWDKVFDSDSRTAINKFYDTLNL